MTDGDLLRGDALLDEEMGLLGAAGAGGDVGIDGRTGLLGGDGHGLAGLDLPVGDPAVGGGPLDAASPDVSALDERAHVVVSIDALDDVGYEQVGDLGDRVLVDPGLAPFQVDLLLVEAGGLDDLQVRDAVDDIAQRKYAASRRSRAHVDNGGARCEALGGLNEEGGLLDRLVLVDEKVVGVDIDLSRADANEVVVGIDDSEARGVDVAVDGADDSHGFFSSRRISVTCWRAPAAAQHSAAGPCPPISVTLRRGGSTSKASHEQMFRLTAQPTLRI